MSVNLSPIQQPDRVELLDTLRGFAIFGILMVNLPLMYSPMSSMLMGSQSDGTLLYTLSESFIKFFFEGKFYVLFSMLFGYGFWIFINKTSVDGRSIVPVFRRRLFFLLLFGIAHVVFLWGGDILFFYALFGFFLILSRKISDNRIISWAIPLALVPTLLTGFFMIVIWFFSKIPEAATQMEEGIAQNTILMRALAEESYLVHTTGNYWEILSMRVREWSTITQGGILVFYPVVLGMFLFGVWAARRKLITNYTEHLGFFRKGLGWGLPVGLIFGGLYAYTFQFVRPNYPGFYEFLNTLSHTVGGFFLCLAYVSSIVLLSAKGKCTVFSKLVSPVGRMALTNYLMHSIIGVILFLPFGFGLFGKIEIWQGIIITILIYLLQIPFSIFWLKHFNYGPFEWLWRTLTYWKIQPFRK